MPHEPPAEFDAVDAALDQTAWGELLRQHEERLRRLVAFRLDSRLRGRVDPADVVQDVFFEACQHRQAFVPTDDSSLYLWLRGIASNKLLELHRGHLGTQMRNASREVSLFQRQLADDTASALAAQIVGFGTRASEAAMRDECKTRLQEALDQLDPLDREALALRHFEQLTSRETAKVLGIEERAASMRYLRALERLRKILESLPGGLAAFAL
ncbi:MAG: sigma-70 family RNA polymerase sigma factor [Planctomycetia bacterium]|nr:sigma-70 family RNA polymerase sigma factor [Planctomycetia bacterium]